MKYWLSEPPIVSQCIRILGVWIFYAPSHIALHTKYEVKISKNKP